MYIIRVATVIEASKKNNEPNYLTFRGDEISVTAIRDDAQKYESINNALQAYKVIKRCIDRSNDQYKKDMMKSCIIEGYESAYNMGFADDMIETRENREAVKQVNERRYSDMSNDKFSIAMRDLQHYAPVSNGFSLESHRAEVITIGPEPGDKSCAIIDIDGNQFVFESWADLQAFANAISALAEEMSEGNG